MEVNKNKKRYVYLDKYLEYKEDTEKKLEVLGKVIFLVGFVCICDFLLSLYYIS